MHRFLLLSLLLALLAACGQTDSLSGAVSAAYPTPDAPPDAAPTPDASPDIAVTPAAPPDVVTTPAATLPEVGATPDAALPGDLAPPLTSTTPLTATLERTIVLPQAQTPSDLVGWSPDERSFMYLQAGAGDTYTKAARLGRIFVLDLASEQATAITTDTVLIGFVYESYIYPSDLPAWQPTCCELSATLIHAGQQELVRIDQTGQTLQAWPLPEVSHVALREQQLVTSRQQAFTVGPNSIGVPLISQTGWMTGTVLAKHGVYAHDNRRLQYVDADGSGWIIDGTDTFLEGDPRITIERMRPSDDGDWLLVTTTVNRGYNRRVWLVERATQQMELIDADFKLSYATLSPDHRTILYTKNGHFNLYDRLRDETHIIPDIATSTYPVWNTSGSQVAILNKNTSTISIFTVK